MPAENTSNTATNDHLCVVDEVDANREVSLSSNIRSDLSLVSFVEGLRHKPGFGLRTWNHLILTLDGRDKVTKLLQYICRLLAWWLQLPNVATSSKRLIADQFLNFFNAERFVALKNSLATSRKAFRLGRSMIEIQKIQSFGILQVMDSYLKRIVSISYENDNSKALSNQLLRTLRTIMQSIFYPMDVKSTSTPSINLLHAPLWNITGNAIKSLGLLIFWAADNMSFLLQSGFLDDYQTDTNDRLSKRSRQISRATNIANRSYFVAAIAGLATNWTTYWEYTTKKVKVLQIDVARSKSNDETCEEATTKFQQAQEKQFILFVALVKSVCDVLVFSNNAGVDLWKRYYGRPFHEGLHCLCGIISATVVLYNNYPNTSDLE